MTRGQGGYSLVELVIVLALIGLITLAIASGLSLGARVWERTERQVSSTEIARGGHAILRTLLTRIYPRGVQSGTIAFEGEASRMSFLADAPSPFARRGVTRFTLTVKRDGGAMALVLVQRAEQGAESAQEEVLFAGATQIAFAYAEVQDGAAVWSDSWAGKAGMPALVRVRAAFPAGLGRWPDLIVEPRVDRAGNCTYDPVSFECRNG